MALGEPEVLRKLTMWEFVFLGIGLTVGQGITVFVPYSISIAGPSAMLLNLLCLGFVLILISCMAEMATIFPYMGGTYLNLRYGLWPKTANFLTWITAWSLILLLLGGLGAECLAFSYYLKVLIPPLDIIPDGALAALLILLLVGINILGVKLIGRVQTALLTFMFIMLILWGALSIPHTQMALYQQPFFKSDLSFFSGLAAFGLIYWAYVGPELMGTMGGEVKYPITTIPKAMFLTVFIVFLVNSWTLAIITGLAPSVELAEMRLGPIATATDFAHAGRLAIMAIALSAVIGIHPPTVNAGLADTSRLISAAGRDGMVPKWFAKLHPRYKTPVNSLLIVGLVLIAVVLPNLVEILGATGTIASCIGLIVSFLAVLSLKLRLPDLKRSFKAPLWFPIVGIIIAGLIIMGMGWYIANEAALTMGLSFRMGLLLTVVLGVLFIVLGITIYWVAIRKTVEEPPSVERIKEEILRVIEPPEEEKEWTELHAPLEAKGEDLKKINRQYRIGMAICIAGTIAALAFMGYVWFLGS
jgi:amino acid transporter